MVQLIGTSSSWVMFVSTRKSCIRITGRNCIMTWISMACKHWNKSLLVMKIRRTMMLHRWNNNKKNLSNYKCIDQNTSLLKCGLHETGDNALWLNYILFQCSDVGGLFIMKYFTEDDIIIGINRSWKKDNRHFVNRHFVNQHFAGAWHCSTVG